MEISGNKYLHKKFKKQTSCSPVYVVEDKNDKSINSVSPVNNGAPRGRAAYSEAAPASFLLFKDNNPAGSVPNHKSTNHESLDSEGFAPRTPKPDNQSSISTVEPKPALSTSCVTNSISKVSLVGNDFKENSMRNFNFDTKLDKSSIIDIAHSKPTLVSKTEADESTNKTLETQEKKQNCSESSGGKYICTYCNLACSKPSVLQKHIRAHTNERPYPCISCKFSFKTRSNLYKHCRSRTHANRVLGNKHVQSEEIHCPEESTEETKLIEMSNEPTVGQSESEQKNIWEQKSKPYKPRFHTAKIFFEEFEKPEEPQTKSNPDLLKLRINELINKNNSIVNSDEGIVIRRRNLENISENNNEYPPTQHIHWVPQSLDEPLNLTSKNRKRCLSDSDNSHKSLIKELLLKNLSSDPNLQCPYCKMIFHTVTELEMHKLKYCNAKTSNIRYARSSSVNVASILTQNKNAFDNIPHMQHTTFPLKSPGPCLGKTRLIENDKDRKMFSFDDNVIMHHSQSDSPSYNKYFLQSPVGSYPLSPLKRNPVKLFGGEVKITQTSGETRSFKIESESINKIEEKQNFMEFNLSENLVIKSTLQSGGTVLQNKTNYSPKMDSLPSPNIIRVYENSDLVPLPIFNEKNKFYDKFPENDKLLILANNEMLSKRKFLMQNKMETNNSNHKDTKTESEKDKELYKSNLMDFGQKAMKRLAPNLKAPNLTIPGLPIPSASIHSPLEVNTNFMETDKQHLENLNFAKKQICLQQKMSEVSQPQTVYNPMNIVVDGKIIRYVPGIPGPIAETPEMCCKKKEISTPVEETSKEKLEPPKIIIDQPEHSSSSDHPTSKESRKFVRPTSLSLKPTSFTFKTHHGLTPTIFNQALISPDTPRVSKKYCQQYLNGNYFSYLGLKSSTKSVYCTLNKTQPFYVKHFKKLSMYSEWWQQESKIDSLSVSAYDSRQRQQKYTLAGRAKADLVAHSSYKFVKTDSPTTKEENTNRNQSLLGGYESNEDYTYIRGRGRGRYVCDQCGIRCKKPSMLKKHIRTHSDDRPYTCEHCNFSFKTKGNLTKHMKSKAHSKKYAATSSTSTQNSVTSSESDESDAESSDESTRLQEHEAAHCLLSLAQKNNQPISNISQESNSSSATTPSSFNLTEFPSFLKDDKFLKNSDQINQVTNTNFAKNKILDTETTASYSSSKHLTEMLETTTSQDSSNVSQYLGKSSVIRPLTYPYLQTQLDLDKNKSRENIPEIESNSRENLDAKHKKPDDLLSQNVEGNLPANIVFRKRKLSSSGNFSYKNTKITDFTTQDTSILDLSPISSSDKTVFNGDTLNNKTPGSVSKRTLILHHENQIKISEPVIVYNQSKKTRTFSESSNETFSQTSDEQNSEKESYKSNVHIEIARNQSKTPEYGEQDQSAMQTLAEIAIKQVKLEKNILAKNVASEYLKLALNNENGKTDGMKKFASGTKEPVNELMVKSEESKNCSICSKNFSKPSQLRLHMNIHYLERPFRCESCSVSFRTRGHLQKHERSAGHHNKLSSSPALSSQEPRPFKCSDCNVAFRIHGHLAKHLRSKLHIMKLECLAKIPFGLYAELERANSLLTEINTTDGDLCLESLKILARKLFSSDPSKLDQMGNATDSRDS